MSQAQFEPGTFRTGGRCANHSATQTYATKCKSAKKISGMCVYLNISCDMLEYTQIPAQPHKRRQNSNLKENFHPRIENSSKKWSMTFFSPKLSFFSRISYL